MSKVNLLLKMAVMKDERTTKGEVEQHSIKHLTKIFSDNTGKMLRLNLLYMVLFALPLLFAVFIWPILAKSNVMTNEAYNFIGHIGIGYPGYVTGESEGLAVLFAHYRKMYFPVIIPCIILAFTGLSGLFHCMRGYMWGEKVKTAKSFFRGVKKLWLPFMITGIVFSGIITAILYGSMWHIELMKLGVANPGSWVLFIFLIIVGVVSVSVLVYLLPLFACYRYKAKDAVKNAVILDATMWFTGIFTVAFSAGVFLLSMAGTGVSIIMCIVAAMFGFVFISGLWTSSAQKAFGNFIVPQYESSLADSTAKGAKTSAAKATKGSQVKSAQQKVGQQNGVKKSQPKKGVNNYKKTK